MSYSYQTADPVLYPLLKEKAIQNRNNPTPAETMLWNYLRARQLGVAFKRQQIIATFIADFACLSSRLIVEVDGGYHEDEQQKMDDQLRTEVLEKMGFRVLRFKNEEVLHQIDKVIETIKNNL